MVKRALLIALGLVFYLIAGLSLAGDVCTKGSEFEPALCPLKLATISRLTMTENAAKSAAEPDVAIVCTRFNLNQKLVRRYLSKAKEISEIDAHHKVDWSPCYASGEVRFSDGSSAQWSVNQFRAGTLMMSDGKKIFLYCPACKFPPFLW